LLIYLSVALGVVLLPQLYGLVPSWLFYSVLGGWLAYLIVAILAATGHGIAYPFAFVLSILTLAVSLPQPEHYPFMEVGMLLASVTFVIGSVLQFALLILIPVYMLRNRSGRKPT
jgi:Ni,Fe-hydrogenase I cytochrome b subunit